MLLMNDRDSTSIMISLVNSFRLMHVSLFVMNNWRHMIFMVDRMFFDNWLLVIGNFTAIYLLHDRLLMRFSKSNFMVCSCVINIVEYWYFDGYFMMAYIVIRSAMHFDPLFT